MIFKVKWSSRFKKGYKLAKKRGLDISLLENVIYKLQRGIPLEEKNRDHELKGNYKGFRECHIEPDWLLMYQIFNDELILSATATGSHSDLFGK